MHTYERRPICLFSTSLPCTLGRPCVETRLIAIAEKPEALTLTESIQMNEVPTKAYMAADGTLQWRDGDGGERCLAVESDVLGFEAEGLRIMPQGFHRALRRVVSRWQELREEDEERLRPGTANRRGRDSMQRLRDCINSIGRPKRLLIILNPFGGKRCGREIFHNKVEPLLSAAG